MRLEVTDIVDVVDVVVDVVDVVDVVAVVVVVARQSPDQTFVHLLVFAEIGRTWRNKCPFFFVVVSFFFFWLISPVCRVGFLCINKFRSNSTESL